MLLPLRLDLVNLDGFSFLLGRRYDDDKMLNVILLKIKTHNNKGAKSQEDGRFTSSLEFLNSYPSRGGLCYYSIHGPVYEDTGVTTIDIRVI